MCVFAILSLVMVLIAMAFFTLLERKILSFTGTRKGPNFVGIGGLFQPLADAMKLFMKTKPVVMHSTKIIFFCSAWALLVLSLIIWGYWPPTTSINEMVFSLVFFFLISSIGGYATLLTGWSSNSMYSLYGSVRAMIQAISYEISFMFLVFVPSFMSMSYSLVKLSGVSWGMGAIIMTPIIVFWLLSILAETNRAPFDFVEGESELVSGFNVEFGGGAFAFFFMAEYLMILFLSGISASVLFSLSMSKTMLIIWGAVSAWFIWIRSVLPRLRYDSLMSLLWVSILPLTMLFFLISCILAN